MDIVPLEAPAVSVTETAEFKAAVEAAVAEGIRRALAALPAGSALASSQGGAARGTEILFRQMAMAIGEIADQGTGRKRIAPEILAQRHAARARMEALISKARRDGGIPVYDLRAKVYLDEVLIDPIDVGADHVHRPTQIEWPGVPNEAMTPVNAVAQEIHAAFMASIGSVVTVVEDGPMMATPGGLTIVGRGKPAVKSAGDGGTAGEGLKVNRHGRNPAALGKSVRVLGTVAEPARHVGESRF